MNAVSKVEDEPSREIAVPAVMPTPQAPAAPTPARAKRRGGRDVLMLVVPHALAAGGANFWVTGGRFQETDNAKQRQAR
ncbi:MAG: HlyD family secretion protein, partial [Rhizobiaceae bacterium]